ncbi:hypothetical protein [Kitasatospora sp. NPDC002965]|uniref:hypothetical protein n=1 Tax=Kitasatospora sp. NPDC002965 TaxID=3154775 RepID=UPI0033B79CF3
MAMDEDPDPARPTGRARGAHRRPKHRRADIPPEPPLTPLSRRTLLRWLAVGTAFAAVSGEEVLRRSLSGPTEPVAAVAGSSTAVGADRTGAGGHGGASPEAAPVGAAPEQPAPAPTVDQSGRRWSDPAGWGGAVPGPRSTVRITDRVLLDTDAAVGTLLVEPTGALTFAADRTLTLAATGNVEIRGALALAPDGTHTHTLRFPAVDERRFQGDGMKVVDTDVGLWVTGAGYLRLDGAAKTAWVRADRELKAGGTELALSAPPAGWLPGDELAVTPTGPPDQEGFAAHYDLVTVRSVSGATVTLESPLKHAHPLVAAGGGVTVGAEVLNLTRTVRVEGTAEGRAHVHLTSSRRADVRHAALRWVGPRADTKETWRGQDGTAPVTAAVLGRYGLHFHQLGDATRGTVVEGVVVRDAGSHAYVPHASHGITFRSCISHETWEDAYWWDGPLDTRTPQRPSDDIVYESCVASRTLLEPNPRAYRLTGFNLGAGTGGKAVDCVAVGVQGADGASGFEWPENSEGVWTFERCLAHNNLRDGIFVWLNARQHHVVTEFAAYHNGGWGIEHGAYLNDFDYTASVLYGNAGGGVALHSLGRDQGTVFDGLLVDAAGQSDFAVSTARHELAGQAVTFSRSRFTGYRRAGVAFRATSDGQPDDVLLLDCEFGGNELWLDPEAVRPKNILLRRAGQTEVLKVRKPDEEGAAQPQWNAAAAPVATFAAQSRPVRLPALKLKDAASPTSRVGR